MDDINDDLCSLLDDPFPHPERKRESPLEGYRRFLWLMLALLFLQLASDRKFGRKRSESKWKEFRQTLEEFLIISGIIAADDLRRRAGLAPVDVPENPTSEAIGKKARWVAALLLILAPVAAGMASESAEFAADFIVSMTAAAVAAVVTLADEPLWYLRRVVGDAESEIRNDAEQAQLAKPEIGAQFPFVEYVTEDDDRVRDRPGYRHAPMHGFIAARSWEGWKKCRPLNGHGCRLRYITRLEARKRGWLDAQDNPTFITRWPNDRAKKYFESGEFPDKGFHGPKFWAAGTAAAVKAKTAG